MQPFLRIVRHPYEEPEHVNLVVSASNGRQRSELEIYANAEDLGTVADHLRRSPKGKGDTVLWELGSERPEDRFAFYYRMRVFPTGPRGLCAVEFRFNNNEAPPEREVAEFSLHALPSDLDRLAALFEGFRRLEHRVLEWRVEDGELRDDA